MEQTQIDPLDKHLADILAHYGTKSAIARVTGKRDPSISTWYTTNPKRKTKPSLGSLLKIEKDTKKKFRAKIIRPELFS